MQRTHAILGSALFLVAAPGVAAGLIPWWLTRWALRPLFLGFELTRAVGAMLILAGVLALVGSFTRFAPQGLGTPPQSRRRHEAGRGLVRPTRLCVRIGGWSPRRLIWTLENALRRRRAGAQSTRAPLSPARFARWRAVPRST
jgi:hypothetical protein